MTRTDRIVIACLGAGLYLFLPTLCAVQAVCGCVR